MCLKETTRLDNTVPVVLSLESPADGKLYFLHTWEGKRLVNWKVKRTGWTPSCPNCSSKDTGFSNINGKMWTWYCQECGLDSLSLEEWIW